MVISKKRNFFGQTLVSPYSGNQVFIYHMYYFILPWISWIFKALQLTTFRHINSKSFTNIMQPRI